MSLVRDVVVFQVKLGLEAVLDLTLIPVSLVAAGFDFLFGHWREPRWFHAVLRFGESCERRIDLWGVATTSADGAQADVDAVIRRVETLIRRPVTGPEQLRELRRWAALKLDPEGAAGRRGGADKDKLPTDSP